LVLCRSRWFRLRPDGSRTLLSCCARGGRGRLQLAIEYARSCGAVALEGYPVDSEGARINVSAAYVGTVSMFEKAGFAQVLKTESRSGNMTRWIIRLELQVQAGTGDG
jgi:hypothetical protein